MGGWRNQSIAVFENGLVMGGNCSKTGFEQHIVRQHSVSLTYEGDHGTIDIKKLPLHLVNCSYLGIREFDWLFML